MARWSLAGCTKAMGLGYGRYPGVPEPVSARQSVLRERVRTASRWALGGGWGFAFALLLWIYSTTAHFFYFLSFFLTLSLLLLTSLSCPRARFGNCQVLSKQARPVRFPQPGDQGAAASLRRALLDRRRPPITAPAAHYWCRCHRCPNDTSAALGVQLPMLAPLLLTSALTAPAVAAASRPRGQSRPVAPYRLPSWASPFPDGAGATNLSPQCCDVMRADTRAHRAPAFTAVVHSCTLPQVLISAPAHCEHRQCPLSRRRAMAEALAASLLRGQSHKPEPSSHLLPSRAR